MLWKGRFKKEIAKITNEFNKSILIDSKMYKEDILGSIAHVKMLGKQNIISNDDMEKIIFGLNKILINIDNGTLKIDYDAEDIHTFVEQELIKEIGDCGKKLHTGRSRNDQVALDIKLYLKKEVALVIEDLNVLKKALLEKAKSNVDTIMPGYTHLQRAQPITYAHYLCAYVEMIKRDISRLEDATKRMDYLPLGSAALAGTTYDLDREYVANLLDFKNVSENSLDGVSDRDFIIEIESALSIIMMHLSRFSEELILHSSYEFKFIELDDSFSTGSSIMPQKKNPDIPELIRGKTGRVYGNLFSILTIMKSLPLAYNKDMQEDKEGIMDSLTTVKNSLEILSELVNTMTILKDNMKSAAKKGFINATDVADYLVCKGYPFRDAYKLTGEIVGFAIENDLTLEEISLEKYKEFSDKIDNDIYLKIDLYNCLNSRKTFGGPSIDVVSKYLNKNEC